MPRALPGVGERDDLLIPPDDRDGRAAQVAFVPEAERESLLAGASRGKPLIGNQFELRKHGVDLGAAMNLEAASDGLDDAHDTAQALALAAFEAEFTQRDPAFLAQLEEREPHLEVER